MDLPGFADTPDRTKVREECLMAKRGRRAFTTEFKAGAVRLVRESGKSVPTVARELDLTETALRSGMRQAEVDAGRGCTVQAPGLKHKTRGVVQPRVSVWRARRDLNPRPLD